MNKDRKPILSAGMLWLLVGLWLLAGCRPFANEEAPTATAAATALPTATSTPTVTPLPMRVAASEFELPSHPPEPVYGAPCGLVDYFDFPLDPPDAGNVRGGRDFGVYRQRYNGIHTGEDWWYATGSSLAMPVYSIGYGQVSYAHTHGWGRDLGTLVIRHVMQSGRTIYSFYGHLDPDSLHLRYGDCVTRGELVGLIGDPRSSPHLHFEIRSVFADQPGPGYWSTDPIRAGWFPPSQTIEESRLAIAPGLLWWHTFQADRVRYLGQWAEDLALIETDDQLLIFDLTQGVELARAEISGLHSYTLWDPDRRWLVTGDMSGRVKTWHLSLEQDQPDPQLTAMPVWQADTHQIGGLELIPLPHNWLALIQGTALTALDPSGNIAWEVELNSRLQGWLRVDEQVLISTDGLHPQLWSVTPQGARAWGVGVSGRLLASPSAVFLFSREGLYHLNPSSQQAQLWIAWDSANLDSAQVVDLPDGRMLVNHTSLEASRLFWLDQEGEIVQQVRYDEAIDFDQAAVLVWGETVFLVTQSQGASSAIVSVFQVTASDRIQLVFRTVTRQAFIADSRWAAIDQGLLLALGGAQWMVITP
ncbi:MAG: M23 family metallopeptidase [Anaerolineales bacterium]